VIAFSKSLTLATQIQHIFQYDPAPLDSGWEKRWWCNNRKWHGTNSTACTNNVAQQCCCCHTVFLLQDRLIVFSNFWFGTMAANPLHAQVFRCKGMLHGILMLKILKKVWPQVDCFFQNFNPVTQLQTQLPEATLLLHMRKKVVVQWW